jgi:hypothetical protein
MKLYAERQLWTYQWTQVAMQRQSASSDGSQRGSLKGSGVQVLEFSRGLLRKRFCLAIVLTPESPEALLVALNEIKATLEQWCNARGGRATRIVFTIMTTSEHFDDCEQIIRQLIGDEQDSVPVLKGCKIEVEFPDVRGKTAERSVILHTP